MSSFSDHAAVSLFIVSVLVDNSSRGPEESAFLFRRAGRVLVLYGTYRDFGKEWDMLKEAVGSCEPVHGIGTSFSNGTVERPEVPSPLMSVICGPLSNGIVGVCETSKISRPLTCGICENPGVPNAIDGTFEIS